MKRTQVTDFDKVEKATDLSELVKDKRVAKRATKSKAIRRNRRYEKLLLKQFSTKTDGSIDE